MNPAPTVTIMRADPTTVTERVLRFELVRYFIASGLALVVDLGTFSLLMRVHELGYMVAATLGFVAGATVAYLFSVVWVFDKRRLRRSPAAEFLLFVIIGIAGLGVTQLVLWAGIEKLGALPEVAKLAAAGATFTFNFVVRKIMLFNSTAARQLHDEGDST